MTTFAKAKQATINEPGSDKEIFTAYIDVYTAADGQWYDRIAVHGNGKEGAEALRDEVLEALQLRQMVKNLWSK